MARERCANCGERFSVATGRENLWSFSGQSTGGLTLVLDGGEAYPLCFECLEALPDHPTANDIDRQPSTSDEVDDL